MPKFSAILYDSFIEIKSGKMLYIFGAVAFLVMLIILVIPSISIQSDDFDGGSAFADNLIGGAAGIFFDKFLGFMVFLMYLGTAWLIPSFLKRGRIELLLSKPISRMKLLSYKFISVYLIMAAILFITAVILWIALSLRLASIPAGLPAVLLSAFTEYLVIFAIIFALGIFTRSGAFALMGYFILKIVSGLLVSREIVYGFFDNTVIRTILDILYHILPKFSEMTENLEGLVTGDSYISIYPIISTLGFGLILFIITLLVFQKRDY